MNKAVKLIGLIQDASDTYIFCNNYLKHSFVNFLSIFLHFIACIWLDLNEISFFLVHMMDEISVDTPCDFPEKILLLF